MGKVLLQAASLALLVGMLGIVSADWFAECPRECMCKWISGKKAAICAGLLLDDIPKMSSDIQHLNLTDNNIQALGERAIAAAGVPHVQKLYLSRCKIREIDKSAFAELGNMIELDLSYNQIPSLHPATFKGLNRLRKLILRGNPLGKLVAYQFPPLRHLTSLDLGECRLTQVDFQAFIHLKSVEVISLRGNRFERLRREPFLPLKNLKSLELFDNPWRCDCLLKDLREWLLETKLYAAPTSCSQPERLHGRTWDTIGKDDFACKPSIEVPDDVVVGYRGDNVTLSCKFAADPLASTKWVLDGRIITNMSQIPFGDQVYVISEGTDSDDSSIVGSTKWLNLTITNINEQDAGDYKCVGVNPGGLAERNVTLRFATVEPAASPVRLALSPLVIAGISVAAVIVFLTVIFLSVTCFYRRRKNTGSRSGESTKKQNGALVVSHHSTGSSIVGISPMRPAPLTSRNGGGSVSYEKVPEETRLNSTGEHDEKSFEDDLLGAESEEFAFLRNDGASGSRSSSGGGGGGGGVKSHQTTSNNIYGGESSSRSTRTPETASLHSDHPPNYFGGHHHHHGTGNYPDLLDIHQGRKYSAPASSNYAEWPSTAPAVPPLGYVTLPRRPRASWSHPVAPVIPPSPAPSLPPFIHGTTDVEMSPTYRADPVYDNLGPRTTADGTLRRSSNASSTGSAQSAVVAYYRQHMQQQQQQQQQPNHAMQDYYGLDYPPATSTAVGMTDLGPTMDYAASRRAFQYSTLPRSTPNVSEAQYSHHHGGYRLPPVREESLGAADGGQRPSVQNLRRDRAPQARSVQQRPNSERPSSTAMDVPLLHQQPAANNGVSNDDSDDADLELPPPPESLMLNADSDMKPVVNKKVPPKPPPKPASKNVSMSISKDPSQSSSDIFQDEGEDGTEI